jgi:hypothetical protein
MERAAVSLGGRFSVSDIVVGAVVLAAVTSLPNAVAAIYLARRGRGAAMLSTALNSNALNIAFGLLVPATLVGLGTTTSSEVFVALWYLGLSALVLGLAYRDHGLRRRSGILVLVAYALFVGTLAVVAHGHLPALALGGPAVVIGAWAAIVLLAPPRPRDSEAAAVDAVAGNGKLRTGRQGEQTASPTGWSPARIGMVGFVLVAAIAAADVLLGSRVILIGLLIVGPCCGVLTNSGKYTLGLSLFALACALAVAIPDGIWLTWAQLAFTMAVVVVGTVATGATVVAERTQRRLMR